jgi:formylmethanofuran dehydrogenase subunit E
MAGLKAVDAHGYFDVEVTCEGPFQKPPKACFLDGLQVGTGATLGKKTLRWVAAEQIAVRVKNIRTGKTAVLRPTSELSTQFASLKSSPLAEQDHDHARSDQAPAAVEKLARKVAAMQDRELIVIEAGGSR